jgi:hypothetical protein
MLRLMLQCIYTYATLYMLSEWREREREEYIYVVMSDRLATAKRFERSNIFIYKQLRFAVRLKD